MRRYGAKRDASEPQVIETAKVLGYGVVQVSAPDLPDLWVWKNTDGWWVEVKTGKAKLRKNQDWPWPVLVWRSADDVLEFHAARRTK